MTHPSRKYMVGLPIVNDEESWGSFLQKHGQDLYSVYFSLPLGNRFHSRSNVLKMFRDVEVAEQFWRLLEITQDAGVGLEMVLNTNLLSEGDVEDSRDALADHGLRISSLTISDRYYEKVREVFCSLPLCYSFNNHMESPDDIPLSHEYSQAIIGRKNIRNLQMMDILRRRGIEPVLLVNNGCNYFCGWCGDSGHCGRAFAKTSKLFDIEYLYALFSVMPSELRDNPVWDGIDVVKISSRNSDVDFLDRCLDSYIGCRDQELVREDPSNYFLWSRLAWFEGRYCELDFERVMEHKRAINSPSSIYALGANSVLLDLTGGYTFGDYDAEEAASRVIGQMHLCFRKDMTISQVIVGSLTDSEAYADMDRGRAVERIRAARSIVPHVMLAIPRSDRGSEWAQEAEALYRVGLIEGVFTEDPVVAGSIGIPTVLGPLLSMEQAAGGVVCGERSALIGDIGPSCAGAAYVFIQGDMDSNCIPEGSIRTINQNGYNVIFSPVF